MKKKKLSLALRWENFINAPKWAFENWLINWIKYSVEDELINNIYFLNEADDIITYSSTTSANYQVGMIVNLTSEVTMSFKIERIEVSQDCTKWYIYGTEVKK